MKTLVERLHGVLTYVAKLIELSEKTVFSCRGYRSRDHSSLVYFEHQLRDREGISLDVQQADGPAWLKINRLPPRDPPPPGAKAKIWLEVGRDPKVPPKVLETTLSTMLRADADRLVECGMADRTDVMVPPSNDPKMADVRLRFDRQPDELKQLVAQYVNETWPAWATQELVRRETIAIYNKFFGVYQTIEIAGAESPTEVVVGVGVALWDVDGKRIEHPLIELPVEIQLDENHAILVRPRDVEPQICLKPFAELNKPFVEQVRQFANAHFESIGAANGVATTETFEVSPFAPASFEPVLRNAVGHLCEGGTYYPDQRADPGNRELPEPTETLTVTDTWAVYARPRSGNYLTRDVERLQNAAKALDDDTLPAITRKLNADPSDVPDFVSANEPRDGVDASQPTVLSQANGHVYFPKPYNEAQLRIVHDLENKDGLVVQGPPGTGKTHTIANIICHYLATGRRVLVTSKGEPALDVLRQQIPEGVRATAMSFLTKQREGLKQMKATAEHILSVARNNRGYWAGLEKDTAKEEKRVAGLRREVDDLDAKITELARAQLDKFVPEAIAGQPRLRPSDAAKQVAGRSERYAWLDDPLGYGPEFAPQFSDADVDAARTARQKLAGDLAYLACDLPKPEDLPDAESLANLHGAVLRACELKELVRTDGIPLVNPQLPDVLPHVEAVLKSLRTLAQTVAAIEAVGWLRDLFAGWIGAAPLGRELQRLDALCQEIMKADRFRELFDARRVTHPAFGDQRENVVAAIDRARKGHSPFPWFSWLSIDWAKTGDILRQIRVSAHPPRDAAEWAHVYAKLRYEDNVLALGERWNALRMESGLSLPEAPAEVFETDQWIATIAGSVGNAAQSAERYKDQIASQMSELFDGRVDPRAAALSTDFLPKAIGLLEVNQEWVRSFHAESKRNALLRFLDKFLGSIVERLRTFIESRVGNPEVPSREIGDAWLRVIAELHRVWGQKEHLDTVQRVADCVQASGAPNWANRLRTEPATADSDPACPADWQAAWNDHRLRAYLTAIEGRREMHVLSEQKASSEKQLADAMAEVVRLKTCLGLCKTMTDARRNALHKVVVGVTYLTTTPNGKLAGVRRREVREAMPECVRAVPCWIMPTWRVSETVPAELGVFDLVIVDEASQSDAMALPTILRAKKLLVVGDDRQVSPTPIGIPFAKILHLQESFLKGHPFQTALLPGSSLYDLGQRVFGNAEMLNEHFRCAEPIIRFSFQFYPKEIIPLRIPKESERLDPPLIDVFVANGRRDARKVNRAEAVAIADEIQQLVNDPSYQNRTIGVVTLLGWEQAAEIQELLLQRLGEDAFLRHRIACGDAATFQGNQRDIMFVSMVASPGKATAQTATLFEQRFNVALSRARDRMYLFRSVGLEHLPNERDLKRKVISHFDKPMPDVMPEADEEECESGFEREFLRRLEKLGYRVRTQVRVGPFRIDLVVEGENNHRLAVELDGDRWHNTSEKWLEDWGRQKTLERMGWTFWRCWASSFHLGPDECIDDLVRTLEKMRIRPLVGVAPSGCYTEHRTIKVDFDGEATPAGDDSETVEVGDQVLVSFEDDAQRHCLLTLSGEKHDLINGIISASDPAGQALLGQSAEEEVELPWNGKRRRAVIVEIQKSRTRRSRRAAARSPAAPPTTATPADSDLRAKYAGYLELVRPYKSIVPQTYAAWSEHYLAHQERLRAKLAK